MPKLYKYLISIYTAVLTLMFCLSGYGETADQLLNPVFKKLTNDNGLSQGTVNCIAQDKKGFIWIGTNDGLNRYDSYKFLVFKNDPNDSSSLRTNIITRIVVDSTGALWIGTEKGLHYFNPSIGNFKRITNAFLGENDPITALVLDNKDNLWIGTQNSGLICLDIKTNEIKAFIAEPGNKNSIPSNSVNALFIDSKNRLWAGLSNGDIVYSDEAQNSFATIQYEYSSEREKLLNLVTAFSEDQAGNLWVATFGNSLVFLNTKNLTLEQLNKTRVQTPEIPYVLTNLEFYNDSLLWIGTDMDGLALFNIKSKAIRFFDEGNLNNNISYRTVRSFFTDKSSNVWIGTNGKGINILSPYMVNFSTITQTSTNNMALKFSSVRSILQENDSILWVGGYSALQKINIKAKKTREYYILVPYALCIDQQNPDLLWIGTEGTGIFQLNKKTGKLSQYPQWQDMKSNHGTMMSAGGNIIYKIVNLDDDHLLVGTNFGLHILNKEEKNYEFFNKFYKNKSPLREEHVNSIFIDHSKRIWIGTMKGGFAAFNPENKTLTPIDFTENIQPGININRINCIFESSKGTFWIGTSAGLLKLDENMKLQKVFSESDGLSNNMVYAILEDENGNLWMSTNLGMCSFNPETEIFSYFDKNDGLPSNEFNSSAYFQYAANKLYFGGVDGLVYFNPANLKMAPVPEHTAVCEVRLFDELNKSDFTIAYNNKITLEPGQKIIGLTFSSLQFFGLKKSNFAFRFDNSSGPWINLGSERNLTLTTLNPGEHTLEVISDNGNGDWSTKPVTVAISVLPEYYQTTWFKALVILLIASAISALYIFRMNLIKQQRIKLEQLVKQRTKELKITNEELESANEAKNKFFSIIAHDLKSPFNAMIGFSNILVDDWKKLSEDEKIEIIALVKNTTEDTYQLLVNLLEWSRVQKKQVEYNPDQINLLNLVKECSKQLYADSFLKNIRVSTEIPPELMIYADANMLHTVIRNLISNAIKFTPKNGWVSIKAKELADSVECCVIDSGVGMAKEEAENLFKLQYRNSTRGTQGETGTGLGLVLCHEFIKKHNGKFKVQSTPGSGSTFCFSIPKLKSNA